jgi:hypothetical protein
MRRRVWCGRHQSLPPLIPAYAGIRLGPRFRGDERESGFDSSGRGQKHVATDEVIE